MERRLSTLMRPLGAGLLLALGIAATSAASKAPEPVLGLVQLRVDVDATGRVVAAEPTAPLPAPLADAVHRHVEAWRFEPPTQAGRAVAGTTYARMSLCAIEAPAGGLAVGFGPAFYGPGVAPKALRPTFFPPISNELLALKKLEMEFVYDVDPEGKARLVSSRTIPAGLRVGSAVEGAFRRWLGGQRFQPERLDGQPVTTRISMPYTFTWEESPGPARRDVAERRATESSPACETLLKGERNDRPVALDSAFRLQPSG
ncbi:hypothetical protein [Lysobacter xanthus]